jgi:hypothetical protein
MSWEWWVVIAVALIALALAGGNRKSMVGGVMQHDRRGRLVLVLTPAKRRRGRGRRR